MTKSEILAAVLAWLHNAKAAAQQDTFWTLASARIAGDLYNVDATAAGWEDASAAANPDVWLYACLREGRIFLEDDANAQTAEAGYQAALGVANSRQRQGASEQLTRPY
jgi:hypothetical protein